jgi:putative heme-binding domain-containing protein
MRGRTFALCLSLVGIARIAAGDESGSIPEWIWGTADRSPAGQTATITHTFETSNPVGRAWLQLAADFCRCQLVLNGLHVATVDDFGPWLELDVTDGLRIGQNRIELTALSSEGPSAIACSLEVTSNGGDEIVIRSSRGWTVEMANATGERERSSAVSFGRVLPQMWTRSARVTSFDDYTQWKQAVDAEAGTNPATFSTRPGFEIRLVRSAASDEGSWISMAFDPQGRLTVSREDRGLLRMTLADDASAIKEVEIINDSLLECRGLLYAYGSLYANANNSKGLYRLRDTTGDDLFDDVTLLREFPGNVGHGRNDLTLGPDGMIYGIHGDAVHVPTEEIDDLTSPFREARRGVRTTEGHLIRTDRDGQRWELIAAGLRNPYGVAFNAEGHAFTYDADAEHDMGAPWYRPTRLVHLFSGADFGWRGRTGDWPPYDPDHADNALPVVDIGKGSPTAVAFGRSGNFPDPYRSALFVLDWAYGRILACHLQPRGAGYVCRPETFLKGRPLNVTDLAFGPDGAMYVITGGRKTQSALYRVAHVGSAADPLRPTQQQAVREEFSRGQREVFSQLAQFHGRVDSSAVETAWPYLGSPDPTLRHAAQTAIEHQPLEQWEQRALAEEDPAIAAVALSAVARSGQENVVEPVIKRLNQLPFASLPAYQQLSLLNAYAICLSTSAVGRELRTETCSRLEALFPVLHEGIAPTGAGNGVNRQLATLLLLRLESSAAVARTMALLRQAETQEDHQHYLFTLRHSRSGWTLADRTTFFEVLGELDRAAFSGAGMPSFLSQIREEAIATLSDLETESLGELVESGAKGEPAALIIDRPFVKEWTAAMLVDEVSRETHRPSIASGRTVFDDAMCSRCHRINGRGGVLGPDLTSAASRFGRRDLLNSIVSPSSVIAEKYRNMQVVTTEGQVFTGRITTAGDYRSPLLRIATDPLKPWEYVEIVKTQVDTYLPSPVSPMPEGLLDTFTAAEILDLLAFLEDAAVKDMPWRESPD